MFWPTQSHNVYGHDPVGVGIRSIPIAFGIMFGACIVLWLLSVFRGRNKELLIASSVLMTAGQSFIPLILPPERPKTNTEYTTGCGALAWADVDNLNRLWGILTIAGLGIGGIVVPASIMTTIICPDVSSPLPSI